MNWPEEEQGCRSAGDFTAPLLDCLAFQFLTLAGEGQKEGKSFSDICSSRMKRGSQGS